MSNNAAERAVASRRQHGGSEPILNMPWGSIFVMKVITRLKEERPYVDKIRPFWAYLIRALVFDQDHDQRSDLFLLRSGEPPLLLLNRSKLGAVFGRDNHTNRLGHACRLAWPPQIVNPMIASVH